jgi:ABC-2 type transport system permease protein
MSYLRQLVMYFRLGLMGEAAYRANFFFQLFQAVLSLLVAVAGVGVVFSYTSSIGGWGPDEILVLVGIYILVGGIIGLVIQPSMEHFIESVRDGTLDFVLTKPDDAQVLVSIQQINIWSLVDLLLGIAVLAVTFVRLGSKLGLAESGEFILLLLAGAVIIYSFFLILATLSFWFVRVENILTIFQSMYEAGRWPVSLYPGWLRYGLTFIIPIAFATTVPAEALTGRLSWGTLLLAIAVAAGLFFASRFFWKVGLRRYAGSSA